MDIVIDNRNWAHLPLTFKLISSFKSDPALWNIRSLIGLLSLIDSFVELTTASTCKEEISPVLERQR